MPDPMDASATRTTKSAQAPRRTQLERTQLTQEKLVRAAIEMLKKRRYLGLRTLDVAELAGVSKGASTHHFPTKDTLVLKALEQVYRGTRDRALNRISSGGCSTTELLQALIEDSKDFFLGEDFLLSLDLLMVDPTSELGTGVKELARTYRLPVEQAWTEALRAAGHASQPVDDVVRLTFALARGFGIRKLIGGSQMEAEHLMQVWLSTAQTMLAQRSCNTGGKEPQS